ncbi:MAG: hypothetical protein ACXW36_07080, partial [Nitrospira sp.]
SGRRHSTIRNTLRKVPLKTSHPQRPLVSGFIIISQDADYSSRITPSVFRVELLRRCTFLGHDRSAIDSQA